MGVKQYLKREFGLPLFSLDHEPVSDFYVSSFQRNRDPLLLLFIRSVFFLGSISMLLSSQILASRSISYGFWWIFFTHWGIIFVPVTSGLAFLVSLLAYRRGPIEEDIYIHPISSILMLILLTTSRQPTRLLHFYFALVAGIIYLTFSLIFYVAGGNELFGSSAIYPMLNWSKPELVAITAITFAISIILMHLLAVGVTAARDALTQDCRENCSSISISNDQIVNREE